MKSVWHDANSEGEGDNGDGEALKALSDESYYSLRLALFSPPSPFAAPGKPLWQGSEMFSFTPVVSFSAGSAISQTPGLVHTRFLSALAGSS